jgi:hypothetical protein
MHRMKANTVRLLALTTLIFTCSFGHAQSPDQKERNLKAFGVLYGQVRFFHPSDEAAKINWHFFSLYGARQVINAQNDVQLIRELKALFQPIAPSVVIDNHTIASKKVLSSIVPDKITPYKLVNWVHHGLSLPGGSDKYTSGRNNRDTVPITYVEYPLSTITLDKATGGRYDFTVEAIGDSLDCDKYRLFISALNNGKQLKNMSSTTLNGKWQSFQFTGNFERGTTSVNLIFRIPKSRYVRINKSQISFKDGDSIKTPRFRDKLNRQAGKQDIYLTIAEDKKFFPTKVTSISDIIPLKLGEGLYAMVPSVLYGTPTSTYPQVDSTVFNSFKKKLKENWVNRPLKYSKEVQYANIVITWSILKYAFPYWNDTNTDPDQLFSFLFNRTITDKNDLDFLETLGLMSAKLNDGHMGIYYDGPDRVQQKSIALVSEILENKIYVKQILDSALKQIPIGSTIDSIDGESSLKTYEAKYNLVSGSPQWRSYKSLLGLFDSPKDTVKLVLKSNGTRIAFNLARNSLNQEYRPIALAGYIPKDGLVSDSVYYYNLTRDSIIKKINASLKELENAKSIIFDMRGYPNDNIREVLSHLVRCNEHTRWMHTPILEPNGKTSSFESAGWNLGAKAPYFKGKIIFLSDACAVSWSESILGSVKGLKLGTIIGKPTSGTNGEVQTISLLDNFAVYFTGMIATNADDSKSHYRGIIPDIMVTSTPTGIKEGRDEVLEKALDLARKHL